MKITKLICDRCGRETHYTAFYNGNAGVYHAPGREDIHLCKECEMEFVSFLAGRAIKGTAWHNTTIKRGAKV